MAARLAAERMPEAQISELRALLDEHAAALAAQPIGYYQEEGDYDFHYRISRGAGNAVLSNVLMG